MPRHAELAEYVQGELTRLADSKRAIAMAAYMKTAQPFYGVGAPQIHTIAAEARGRYPPATHAAYLRNVRALWKLPHREPRYIAIEYGKQREFLRPDSLPLFEQMVRDGAWWDFVDGIAASLVGMALLDHRKVVQSVLDGWITDGSFWIRRTAILAQLRHKSQTDSATLLRYCLTCAAEREFFIRKAIGWALREYSKSNPGGVAAFLKKNRVILSPLSLREGAKHLIRIGRLPDGFPKT